ncbi:MAG: UDP-N-acetylmuramoyl-tripeptide--D-alanyl-D-alanine ligase, partial [Clostridia bacterium]|nr:UDP-N-acetylmuramoyl-tripeptide--D-alanyl-D-alanine ligase [Clostridia bacterium]
EDCYNASPESMVASLKVLCQKGKEAKKIAILGDMLELGSYSETFHRNVGEKVAQLGINKLYTFGEMAEYIGKGAIEAGMDESNVVSITDLEKPELLADLLAKEVENNDTLLFKASRGVKLERITAILCNKEG